MQPRLTTLAIVAVVFFCKLLVHAEPLSYTSQNYNYWSDSGVDLPKLFGVDQNLRLVVVAATNTIFHVSLDLKDVSNAQDVTPPIETVYYCKFVTFKPGQACQNFHHILYFQSGPGYITTIYGNVPKEEAVLVCGSNAYSPQCVYRNRTSLEILTRFEASGLCPLGEESGVSHVSKSEQIVAGLALDPDPSYYAITLSTSPISGDILLKTVGDDFLYFNHPKFVSLYENEDFYYLFVTESPVESWEHATFSRVARVCKNDAGRTTKLGQVVFVTYVKARMACKSNLLSTTGFDYNVLQDIVLVNSSSANAPVSGEHLYGVFTGEIDGPLGSALCFYTFDGLNETLSGNFLVQSSVNEWTEEENDPPLTCSEGRSLESARNKVLIKDVARQEKGEPMFLMDATVFHKLLVDTVTAVDQKEYEVILIAASVHDSLQLLKLTHIPSRKQSDKSFVIQSIPLDRNGSGGNSQDVGKMELYKTDDEVSVYLSTAEGLYVVSITNCSAHSDCRTCVEARDPYCAYDISKTSCISLLGNTEDSPKLQDVVNGDSTGCEVHISSHATLTSSPLTIRPEPSLDPCRDADAQSQANPSTDRTLIAIAAVGGLIVGIAFGLVLCAATRKGNNFLRVHSLLHRS